MENLGSTNLKLRATKNEVLVEFHALALCPYAEINQTALKRGGQNIVSVGAAGVVKQVAGVARARFQIGDEVWTRKALTEPDVDRLALVDANELFPVPIGITLAQAATLGDSGLMALTALRIGNVRRNSRLLIQGAANPFGSAAIQLARYLGAEAIVTVESLAEVNIAKSAGATEIALSNHRDANTQLAAWAGKAGFDIIFDCALAEHMPLNANVLAQDGMILTCPLQGREGLVAGLEILKNKNGKIHFLAHNAIEQYQLRELAVVINDAIATNFLRPLVGQIVSPNELTSALTRLARGRVVGNLVLMPQPAV
jgi:NADPH:quinone reductase-like Zn-dependent oxidoreductase